MGDRKSRATHNPAEFVRSAADNPYSVEYFDNFSVGTRRESFPSLVGA